MTHSPDLDTKPWLSTKEAADQAGVSVRTLYRYEEAGYIGSSKTAGGHRRFRREDVEALLTSRTSGDAA